MSAPLIVPATEADVREMASRRTSDEASYKLYVELARTAPRGAWVARDEGTPIGMGFAHALEEEWYLSELYVESSFRRNGVGRQLLDEVARDAGDVWRSGMLDATATNGLAFFLKRGVGLRVPVVELSGAIPKEEELARMAAGDYRFAVRRIDAHAHRTALDAIDRDVRGSARLDDHSGFAELAIGTLFLLNEELAGYVYVWPDGRIGPLAAASPAYLVQFFGFALMSLRRTYHASWCTLLSPGSNTRVLRVATRLGLSIVSVRIFATDRPEIDLSRYIGFHPFAF
jgi:GNAT superfamily N-acetyltransferase